MGARAGMPRDPFEEESESQPMKIMKKSMLRAAALFCGAALVAGTAIAQQDAPPPPPQGQGQGPGGGGGGRGMGMDPARRLQMLQDRLNLTADQSTQIKAILDDGQTKMQALRANTALSQDDRRSQGMALRNDENTKIEAVLTADQKTQYEQMLAQQRDRMRNGGGPGGPSGGGSAPPPPPPPPGA